MPAADIFNRALRVPVYFKRGVFQNDTRRKLSRASFDLVQIDSDFFIQPVTSPVPKGCTKVNGDAAVFAETEDNFYKAQEEFFEDGTRMIIEEHELGSWVANHKNWKDCFTLSKI